MKSISRLREIITSNQFNSLTSGENGLILNRGKKGEKEISFSELDKIYIKKNKLHPLIELLIIGLPFLLIYTILQYAPYEMLIIAAVFTIIPVFIAVHNYKWYVLKLRLKNGTSYYKIVSNHLKSESVSLMEKVYNQHLYYNAHSLISA